MTSEVDLEEDTEVLPVEPRRSCGELFLSQLSVSATIQACKVTQTGFAHLGDISIQVKMHISWYWTYSICIRYSMSLLSHKLHLPKLFSL